jgi:hypothetical protein
MILILLTAFYVVLWVTGIADWKWFEQLEKREYHVSLGLTVPQVYGIVFGASVPLGLLWLLTTWFSNQEKRTGFWAVASVVSITWWQLLIFVFDHFQQEAARGYSARVGTGVLFFIGLIWVVWFLDRTAKRFRVRRKEQATSGNPGIRSHEQTWNPLDPEAWYYGRKQQQLNQSVTAFFSYSVAFLLVFIVLTQMGGCTEEFDLPAGGGEQAQIAQKVKIQKVIRKKYVLNPLSQIIFNVPPIEEIRLKINEITKHAYKIGQGKGKGSGFAGGTSKGKIRFVRLKYDGNSWNLGMGIGKDVNLLVEYGGRLKQRVSKKTEWMRISRLKRYPPLKSPPLVFITGLNRFTIPKSDRNTLKEYLLEKHGMIFASAGSPEFDRSFRDLMTKMLPTVRPVAIPLDDPIQKFPYQIPFFPYVAPHGAKESLGWKVEGRWVAFYHSGDIVDAWADDHGGVRADVWEACYQLGCNVIFYAYREHSIWRQARRGK